MAGLQRREDLRMRQVAAGGVAGCRVAVEDEGRPVPRSSRLPSAKVPTRSLGPCRSTRMPIGCLASRSIVRITSTFSGSFSRGRWLMLSRNTSTPARNSASRSSPASRRPARGWRRSSYGASVSIRPPTCASEPILFDRPNGGARPQAPPRLPRQACPASGDVVNPRRPNLGLAIRVARATAPAHGLFARKAHGANGWPTPCMPWAADRSGTEKTL